MNYLSDCLSGNVFISSSHLEIALLGHDSWLIVLFLWALWICLPSYSGYHCFWWEVICPLCWVGFLCKRRFISSCFFQDTLLFGFQYFTLWGVCETLHLCYLKFIEPFGLYVHIFHKIWNVFNYYFFEHFSTPFSLICPSNTVITCVSICHYMCNNSHFSLSFSFFSLLFTSYTLYISIFKFAGVFFYQFNVLLYSYNKFFTSVFIWNPRITFGWLVVCFQFFILY